MPAKKEDPKANKSKEKVKDDKKEKSKEKSKDDAKDKSKDKSKEKETKEKDKTPKAITFKKGPPLETYCSDSTIITFYPKTKQPVVIGSVKRMSCKILAIFNLNKQQNSILRDYPLDSIKIHNYVTENKYTFPVQDPSYFNRWIYKYNHWK